MSNKHSTLNRLQSFYLETTARGNQKSLFITKYCTLSNITESRNRNAKVLLTTFPLHRYNQLSRGEICVASFILPSPVNGASQGNYCCFDPWPRPYQLLYRTKFFFETWLFAIDVLLKISAHSVLPVLR